MAASRFFTVLPIPFANQTDLEQKIRVKKRKPFPIRFILTHTLLSTKDYKDLDFMKDTYSSIQSTKGHYTNEPVLLSSTIFHTEQTMMRHAGAFMNMFDRKGSSNPKVFKDRLTFIFSSVTEYNKAIEYINKKTGHVPLPPSTLLDPTDTNDGLYTIFDMYYKVGRKYITISEYQREYCVKKKGCYADLCNMLDEYLDDVLNELINMEKFLYEVASELHRRFRDIDMNMIDTQDEQDELIRSALNLDLELTDKLKTFEDDMEKCKRESDPPPPPPTSPPASHASYSVAE
jgi:hypothetical protein